MHIYEIKCIYVRFNDTPNAKHTCIFTYVCTLDRQSHIHIHIYVCVYITGCSPVRATKCILTACTNAKQTNKKIR